VPLKTIVFAGLFAVCAVGALLAPALGVLGYVGHYSVGPERQWWNAPLARFGLRYSFILAMVTAVGIALNWRKIRSGRSILAGQEKLVLLFLGCVWLSVAIGEETIGRYTIADHPSVKLTKVVIFVLMLSHVVTDLRNLDRLFWVLIIGALVLGLQAYAAPRSAFARGRLNSVGGPDFHNANRLAGYLAGMLFVIGAQFLRCSWKGKLACLAAGAFATNAIILTRSRGALVGVVSGGLVAIFLAPKKHRRKILLGLAAAFLGGMYLTDPQFVSRASTISGPEEARDASAQSRIDIWLGSIEMVKSNPLGVGAGNFYQAIGRYAPRHPNRDAHNTFVRCAGDLGIQGFIVFVAIIVNSVKMLRGTMKQSSQLPPGDRDRVVWATYGAAMALAAVLGYGMTGTLLYTEYLWWLLLLPVCLQRVVDNLAADRLEATAGKKTARRSARATA